MSESNIYFKEVMQLFPEEVVSIFTSIEESFSTLLYEHHYDDLYRIFVDYPNASHNDLMRHIRDSYIEHTLAVLQVQGILIKIDDDYPLHTLACILSTTVILNLHPASELVELQNIDPELSGVLYFSEIVHLLTNEEIVSVINQIEHVSSSTVDLLKANHELTFSEELVSTHAAERFKSSTIEKNGMVVNLLKGFDNFGYSITPFFEYLADPLNAEKDPAVIANEIILLVLGSNTVDEHLKQESLKFAEKVILSAELRLKTFIIIEQYFKSAQ